MTDTPDRILRLETVLNRTGLSRSTLYRKVDQGSFPAQVRIAARCVGSRESAVSDWMRNPMFYNVADTSSGSCRLVVGPISLRRRRKGGSRSQPYPSAPSAV